MEGCIYTSRILIGGLLGFMEGGFSRIDMVYTGGSNGFSNANFGAYVGV